MKNFKRLLLLLVLLMATMMVGAKDAKNIIWVIGDGMGPELMGFFMQGARYGHLKDYPNNLSNLEVLMQKGVYGLYFNNTKNTIVTDSASAATQMATGALSNPGVIGMNADLQPVETLFEMGKSKGKSIGVVSDVYITDATPGGFTAHVKNRRMRREIAKQQIALEVDVISGGGKKYFTTKENENLLNEAKEKGYQVVSSKEDLSKVQGKFIGLYTEDALPMSIELYKYPQIPTLLEQTQKAIEVLSKNKNGFMLMVEAGKIDWAAHANDAGSVLAEMKVLDAVLGYVKKYADEHSDTLVYVNADHDTGLGTFTYRHLDADQVRHKNAQGEMLYDGNTDYASFNVFALLEKQKRCLFYLEEELKQANPKDLTPDYVQSRLQDALGYDIDISWFKNLTDVPGIFKQLNERYGLSWATGNHSASPLIGIAYGRGASSFSGVYHNTDIISRMKKILGWK